MERDLLGSRLVAVVERLGHGGRLRALACALVGVTSDVLYGNLWAEDPSRLDEELARSLGPRATAMLYGELARLGVRAGELVLDAGARDAVHAIELVRRLDCRAL